MADDKQDISVFQCIKMHENLLPVMFRHFFIEGRLDSLNVMQYLIVKKGNILM